MRHLLLIFALLLPSSASIALADTDHVVVILDASGSMGESFPGATAGRRLDKMTVAKDALLSVLETVPPRTQVGIVVFSGRNVPQRWVVDLGLVDLQRTRSALDPIRPKGATPLGAYLKIGADRLLEARSASGNDYGTYRLLVVTDGEAEDQRKVDQHLPDILARGITVDVIGVDMDADLALATRVHSYRRADRPDELTRALADVFAEVGTDADDAITADMFDLIEPLPDGAAMPMLAALDTVNNEPIGTRASVATPGQVITVTQSNTSVGVGTAMFGVCAGFVIVTLLIAFIGVISVMRIMRHR
ncbi:MAG: vWA domain-containing protein [Planctomycetota bacterium]